MAMKNYGGLWRDLNAECAAWNAKQAQMRLAAQWHKRNEIDRVCARYELEPDEFFTAEQKALAIIGRKS